MSTLEKSVEQVAKIAPNVKRKSAPILNQVLDFLSSVKFGIVLLCILVFLSFLGMIIIQQNVQGFNAYFASLTPAEKTVYGFLGFFDIYYSWYFKLTLLILSLNIVLASIDRFPSAWSYISRPKLEASSRWLTRQKQNAVIQINAKSSEQAAKQISSAFKNNGLKTQINKKNGKLFIFGESGRLNRLGPYIVHAALLTLFLGHFVSLQTGFDADVRFMPGQTTNEIQLIEFELDRKSRYAVSLPFTITCTDIEQKLIDPKGPIDTFNTLDWRTQIRIDDPQYGQTTADVALNKPFSYRGYRFFQAQTVPVGNARRMTLELISETGNAEPVNVELKRNGKVELNDGTLIEHEFFLPDFTFNQQGQPDTKSKDYNNPAAVLQVTPKGGEKTRVFAFTGEIADSIPVGAPKVGYKWRLKEFEKSPLAHVLSIKYDPFNGAFIAWYFGGIGLMAALIFVFFTSHKRVWALIKKDEQTLKFKVVLGGHINRSHEGFKEKFNNLVIDINEVNKIQKSR